MRVKITLGIPVNCGTTPTPMSVVPIEVSAPPRVVRQLRDFTVVPLLTVQ